MNLDEMKKTAREYYEIIDANGGRLPTPDPRFGKSVYHGEIHTGHPDEKLRAAEIFYTAFPDFRHVIEAQVAEGDIVAERITYFATHMGLFMGIEGTGAKVTWTGCDFVRFENGAIVERWGEWDSFGLYKQLVAARDSEKALPPSD